METTYTIKESELIEIITEAMEEATWVEFPYEKHQTPTEFFEYIKKDLNGDSWE